MMRYARPANIPSRPGFTLIELLVVISIISLLLGLSFPYMRAMVRSGSEQMAANSVANAVSAARSFAVRYKPFTDSPDGSTRDAETSGDGYSGAAVIVTPANELRVFENDELGVWAPTGERLELPSAVGQPIRNGFIPIADNDGNVLIDDLLLPRRVAILGIQRTGDDEIQLLPPPFAIAFNRRGTLATRNAFIDGSGLNLAELGNLTRQTRSDGSIYHAGSGRFEPVPYDNNGDGVVDPGETRDVPAYLNTNRSTFVTGGFDAGGSLGTLERLTDFARGTGPVIEDGPTAGRRAVPFDRLEPVVGVVIFNPEAVPARYTILSDDLADVNSAAAEFEGKYHPDRARAIVIDTTGDDDENLLGWAARPGQGEILFFNRNTGNNLNR